MKQPISTVGCCFLRRLISVSHFRCLFFSPRRRPCFSCVGSCVTARWERHTRDIKAACFVNVLQADSRQRRIFPSLVPVSALSLRLSGPSLRFWCSSLQSLLHLSLHFWWSIGSTCFEVWFSDSTWLLSLVLNAVVWWLSRPCAAAMFQCVNVRECHCSSV